MRLRKFLAPLFAALAVLVVLLFAVAWLPLRQARAQWRAGRVGQAIAQAKQWSRLRLWPSQYHQLLAAANLTAGGKASAQPHLDALAGRRLWLSVVSKDEVARRLFARGAYDDFLAYDNAVHELRENEQAKLDRAAALLAVGRIDEAQPVLATLGRRKVDRAKVAALEQRIAERRQGSYPFIVDRNGQTIAVYQMSNKDLVATNRDFEALVDKSAGALTIGSRLPLLSVNERVETTLDAGVQKAAMQALGGFRGSLVAIDPRTNELLAIASNRGSGPLADLALEKQYEPGSIVKVLTGLNAYESGVDLQAMFPYDCKGDLIIDGRHFGDWMAQGHGVLPALDDAFAQSCNIVFADLGLRLGADRLHAFMSKAGFDSQADLGLMTVPLGRNVGQTFNRYETAFYAIGLAHESMNALHVAMLASMMANRGLLTSPRLLRGRRSLLGDELGGVPAQTKTTVAKRENAERMVRAMVAVATSAKGTGRRAPVDGVPMAMKTGTAGDRDHGGLEALILAFAPVDDPRIAFGVIAEDAGPAEFAGAKIAHDFVAAWNAMPPR
jgi:hypothetical protein